MKLFRCGGPAASDHKPNNSHEDGCAATRRQTLEACGGPWNALPRSVPRGPYTPNLLPTSPESAPYERPEVFLQILRSGRSPIAWPDSRHHHHLFVLPTLESSALSLFSQYAGNSLKLACPEAPRVFPAVFHPVGS